VDKKTTRKGNYESGSDYVLEYGELRFSFNEEDFGQRVEQAAVKLGFVDQGLSQEELDDLLDLAVSGEIAEPASPLGEHINENWEDLVGPSNRSLVHWLRRLVFRGAWLPPAEAGLLEQLQHVLRRASYDRALSADEDRTLDEDRVLGHGVEQRRLVRGAVEPGLAERRFALAHPLLRRTTEARAQHVELVTRERLV
jgi:hypothetical protein